MRGFSEGFIVSQKGKYYRYLGEQINSEFSDLDKLIFVNFQILIF